ncbi:MAG: transcription elongation factor GreA [Pseudomonadota bacterium]
MEKIPMTTSGHQWLETELKRLKNEERPAVIQAIAEARAHGDLSENAEYHAAKEKQGWIEGQILEFEDKVGRAQVIEPSKLSGDRVVFGATVTILSEESEEEKTWQIVGDFEADVKEGKISLQSPIARGMIGKEEGDTFEVSAPGGVHSYEIMKIAFR